MVVKSKHDFIEVVLGIDDVRVGGLVVNVAYVQNCQSAWELLIMERRRMQLAVGCCC
jgi:hypothetical protein